jgi:hypothetical protein
MAQEEITADQETQVMENYRSLRNKVKLLQARVYLEETVNDNIEVNQYLKISHAVNVKKTEEPSLCSAIGFSHLLDDGIRIGDTVANFQVIARKDHMIQGKTVLAFPALLHEF